MYLRSRFLWYIPANIWHESLYGTRGRVTYKGSLYSPNVLDRAFERIEIHIFLIMEKAQSNRPCSPTHSVKCSKILLNRCYYKQRGVAYEYSHFFDANMNIQLPLQEQRYVDFRMDCEYYKICTDCFSKENEREHRVSRYMPIKNEKYISDDDGDYSEILVKDQQRCYICKTTLLYRCAVKIKCETCNKTMYKIKPNVWSLKMCFICYCL